uniref:Uncharacterized protein n=1 Tax=Caenorhabditis tropicalis TaxID=1561998 RepID=A0A1I7V3X8_9PELO
MIAKKKEGRNRITSTTGTKNLIASQLFRASPKGWLISNTICKAFSESELFRFEPKAPAKRKNRKKRLPMQKNSTTRVFGSRRRSCSWGISKGKNGRRGDAREI